MSLKGSRRSCAVTKDRFTDRNGIRDCRGLRVRLIRRYGWRAGCRIRECRCACRRGSEQSVSAPPCLGLSPHTYRVTVTGLAGVVFVVVLQEWTVQCLSES